MTIQATSPLRTVQPLFCVLKSAGPGSRDVNTTTVTLSPWHRFGYFRFELFLEHREIWNA